MMYSHLLWNHKLARLEEPLEIIWSSALIFPANTMKSLQFYLYHKFYMPQMCSQCSRLGFIFIKLWGEL